MNGTAARRPADFPHDTTLHALLDAFFAFLAPITNANYGIGEPQTADQVADAALGALAAQHALLDRLAAMRWCTVRDALVYGATIDQVAEAMALERDEVAAGLRSWADGQHEHGLMTGAQRDEVLQLVDQPHS